MNGEYTSNIQKGGAMISDCLSLLREWQLGESPAQFAERVVRENTLGKASRSRVRDLLSRIFFRRFAPPIVDNLHRLVCAGLPHHDLQLILLYHTARADALLYQFVTRHLMRLSGQGRLFLDTTDGMAFINELTERGLIAPAWSEQIRLKTSRGLLAACRDFGLLEGFNRKRFAHPYITQNVFLYVAYSLRDQEVAPAHILSHPDWYLFLMDEADVERKFLLAHQEGHLRYEAAGGIRRIDWTWPDLAEFVAHLAQGAHSSST